MTVHSNPVAPAASGTPVGNAFQRRALLLEADLSEPADTKGYTRLIWLLAIAAAGFVAWAAMTPVYETVTGEGRLMPLDGVRTLQSEHGGRVTAVHVRQGSEVRAGDPLVTFDRSRDLLQLKQLRVREAALRLELDLQSAILGGTEFTPTSSWKTVLSQSQQASFLAEAAAVRSRLDLISADLDLASARKAEASARLMELDRRRVILAERLVSFDRSFSSGGFISRRDRDQAELSLIEAREQIAVATAERRTAEISMQKARREKAEYLAARKSTAARAVAETEAKMAELREEIARYQLRADSGVLVSPLDGVVQAVEVDTKGQVISPGGPVAEVVPEGAELFAEVLIPASRIGGIEPGFAGALTLLTFDAAQFGTLAGTVVSVSPSSEILDSSEAAYLVRLSIGPDLGTRQQDLKLRPGLSVSADIRLGSKTVFEYFLKPLRAIRDAAFSEQ
ncbi:HlyD family type I secretion periplasmic adaptor subunit [Leisingera aquimarina]|uniref:HlyD family type I secretion periplasmic adaptor subunit n=1 Tax=Leisingera aquimarina TaxID=476529 RepID=UPI000400AA01|nr:HlyD family type I secretion periplasmic adaptor subunit [Leisingera aquimarina]